MRRLAAAVAAVAAAAAVPLATAGPVCTGATPDAACGGRVVPEPLAAATFIQYGSEIFPVLDEIEALAPDVVEVFTLDELTGDEAHLSAEGRKVPVVRLTDESVPPAGKRKVAISLSIHANEPAGREGGVRWIEDVARWWAGDKEHPLYTGDVSFPIGEVMAQTEVWLGIANPDGWEYGDLGNSNGTFQRGNGNGTDLNRQFPTMGWHDASRTPMSEPEAVGWATFVRGLGKVTTASDIHGELTSANNAFSDLMWPADQWTPKEQAQELQLGLNVIRAIERKFDEYGVKLGDLTGATDTMKPASAATGYDVVNYDDSGFLGDWFTQETGAIDIDAENFLSHLAPGNVWIGPLEEAHVAAVRGIVEAVVVESMITDQVRPKLDLGRVAYVFDPARTTGGGTDGAKPYDATRMKYFEDLAATGAVVVPVDAADVAAGSANLSSYDSLVVADTTLPADRLGRPVAERSFVDALRSYAAAGGQLVLTDKAVQLLSSFGFGNEGDLVEATFNAGHVDFGDRSHDWEQDLVETASQTYYEVPLGFPAESAAPHYSVSSAAWQAKEGVTVGTVDPDGTGEDPPSTILGEMPYEQGKVSIFGAILPQPSGDDEPKYGLADYGVTIAGGQVLHSMLSYRRPGSTATPPAPAPKPDPNPPVARPRPPQPGRTLPSTGWDPTPLLLGVPAAAAAFARRRRTR